MPEPDQLIKQIHKLIAEQRKLLEGRLTEQVAVRYELNPPGNWFVPPGSNQSSSGSNETAEASGAEGR